MVYYKCSGASGVSLKGGCQRMKKVFKNQFIIKSWSTGSRLRNCENQREYAVFTKDGSRCVKRGFYTRRAADRWLRETVNIANTIFAKQEKDEG